MFILSETWGTCSTSPEGHQVLYTAGSLWRSREDPGVFGASIWGRWSSLSVSTDLQSAPNVSHYSVWKVSYSFRFFTSSYIRGNPIFHISFCFVDVIVRDAGSQAAGPFWLWSAWPQLIVNGEQMKEIFTNFMGIQAGPKLPLMPPFTANVYWIFCFYCVLQCLYSIRL